MGKSSSQGIPHQLNCLDWSDQLSRADRPSNLIIGHELIPRSHCRQYRKNIPTCTSCRLNPTPQKKMSTEFKIDLYVKGYEEDHGSRTVSRGCIAARLSFMRCGPRHSRFVFVSGPMRSVYLRLDTPSIGRLGYANMDIAHGSTESRGRMLCLCYERCVCCSCVDALSEHCLSWKCNAPVLVGRSHIVTIDRRRRCCCFC